MAGGSKKKLGGSSRTSSWYKVKKTAEAAGAGNERPAAGAHVVIQPRADRRVQVVAAQRRCHRPSHITSQDRGPPTRLAQNENRTGLAQIVGQLYGSNMDFQPKCWAKRCNLGQPCAIFAQGREGRDRACGARRTPGGRGRRAACERDGAGRDSARRRLAAARAAGAAAVHGEAAGGGSGGAAREGARCAGAAGPGRAACGGADGAGGAPARG